MSGFLDVLLMHSFHLVFYFLMCCVCSEDSDTESEGQLAEEEEDADGGALERSGLAARVSRRDTQSVYSYTRALYSCAGLPLHHSSRHTHTHMP